MVVPYQQQRQHHDKHLNGMSQWEDLTGSRYRKGKEERKEYNKGISRIVLQAGVAYLM